MVFASCYSCHVQRNMEIQASTSQAVSLHSASLPDPRFLASEDLPPACPPSHDKSSFFERIERRETHSHKNEEVLSPQLHPPANLNHRGTDLFLQSFSESSALVSQTKQPI
ncbi:hypothetical protein CRENBAI_002615 [Crenichthys baileyi]|uniref:Uncharacterized protein n=1 Tax=Crenichthys baileyi TaxID=28760 RepID=A0AAV9R4F0_9TELE